MEHEIVRRAVAGHDGRVLRSPAGLEATYLPSAGMLCCSLRHRGTELLGQRGGVERYVSSHSTMGIPLLHPWANRLAQRRFPLGGRELDVDRAAGLGGDDPNGLPIHGLLAGLDGWRVERESAGADHATLAASFEFASDERLIAAFPFPHRLELEITLGGQALQVLTTLRPSGDVAVPMSFGYHPYLTLPGVPREQWEVELPVGRHIVVGARGIPTGELEPASGVEPGSLAGRTFDDGYAGIEPGAAFAVAGGGRRVEVTFDEGYPFAQVYAPEDETVICFEPMTAPTNALCSGEALRWVAPGDAFTARFTVSVG